MSWEDRMNEKNPKKNQNPISEENLSKILKKPKEIQRPLKAWILIEHNLSR